MLQFTVLKELLSFSFLLARQALEAGPVSPVQALATYFLLLFHYNNIIISMIGFYELSMNLSASSSNIHKYPLILETSINPCILIVSTAIVNHP